MAPKNRKNGRNVASEAPEGFDISAARTRGEGWAKKEPGNVVRGILLQRVTYEGTDGERAFYQVRLTAPCQCVVGEGEEAVVETLQAGALVNVDELAGMIGLKTYVGNGGEYEVWLRYDGKPKKQGDSWALSGPALKQIKAPVRERVPF